MSPLRILNCELTILVQGRCARKRQHLENSSGQGKFWTFGKPVTVAAREEKMKKCGLGFKRHSTKKSCRSGCHDLGFREPWSPWERCGSVFFARLAGFCILHGWVSYSTSTFLYSGASRTPLKNLTKITFHGTDSSCHPGKKAGVICLMD